MKKYILSGAAALLLSALATPGYCTTIVLNFDANASGPNGIPCSTTVMPFSCIGVGGQGAALSPAGSPAQFATTLSSFGNIVFNEVTVTGDSAINGGAATSFAFTSTGSDFAYSGTTLTNTGTITAGPLSGVSGTLITDSTPTVVATQGGGFAPVYFADGTVTVASSLLNALGLSPGSYTAWLGSDAGSGGGTGCNYPEGARDPQTMGPLAGTYAGGCAVGFGPNNTDLNAESQYLEVVISSVASPEPESSLLLGFGLVAVGSLARKTRRKDTTRG